MDLLNGELGSSNKTCVTSTLDGNEVIGIEAERVSDIPKVAGQETSTIPPIMMEPNVQMTSASLSYETRKEVHSETSVIACEPRSLHDLPDEILLKILSYFGPEDLVVIIAEVCKRWADLAKDVVLWKTLTYSCDQDSNISIIEEVLTAAPALHSLIIRQREDVADILGFLFHKHVDLRKLILYRCCLGEDSTALLTNFVALCPDLEGLSLELCRQITSDGYRLIPRLKQLSELNLVYCHLLSGETARLIADSCLHLKKLTLGGDSQISDEDVIHVIDRLGKQLTSFVLLQEGLTDVANSYLKNCARLQELKLHDFNCIGDRGLLEGIGSLKELTSLCFGVNYNLTAQALSTFLHRPSMTSIVLLSMWGRSNLDDEGFKGIAKRCIHLKELTVRGSCDVSDAGLSIVISHCSQLRVLHLFGLPSITGEGCLALVPSHLPHLRELWLQGCDNLRDKYVKELKAAAPKLKVVT